MTKKYPWNIFPICSHQSSIIPPLLIKSLFFDCQIIIYPQYIPMKYPRYPIVGYIPFISQLYSLCSQFPYFPNIFSQFPAIFCQFQYFPTSYFLIVSQHSPRFSTSSPHFPRVVQHSPRSFPTLPPVFHRFPMGVLHRAQAGVPGFLLGVLKGTGCALGLALGGSAAGCAQLLRGVLNTPEVGIWVGIWVGSMGMS